jgi:O-antigen ligase
MIPHKFLNAVSLPRFNPRMLLVVSILLILIIAIISIGTNLPYVYIVVFAIPLGVILILNVRWMLWVFIAMLPMEMMLVGDVVTIPKILGVLMLISWLLSIVRARRRIQFDRSLFFYVLFLMWGFISFFWTIDSAETTQKLITYSQLFVFYLILTNVVRTKKDIYSLLYALWFGGLVFVGFGIFDILTGQSNSRIEGVSGNANLYALWCVTTLPAFLVVAKKGGLLGLVSVAGIIGLLVSSTYAQSRGGIISIAVFAIILLIYQQSRFRNLFIVVLAGLLIWQFAPPDLWIRFESIGNETSIDRLRDIWPVGWRLFTDHLLLGLGLGTNGTALDLTGRLLTHKSIGSVHNAPLAIAMEVGIPGLVLYLAFIAIPSVRILTSIKKLKFYKQKGMLAIATFLIAGLAAFLASWIKGGALEFSKMLWLLLGLATCMANYADNLRGSNEQIRDVKALIPTTSIQQ